MDITEVILVQHHQQRRLFALLDEVDQDDIAALGAVWKQLAISLEVHAAAEEKYFHPRVLGLGHGAGGAVSAAGETEDAVNDYNDVHDAIARPEGCTVSSKGWWRAPAKMTRHPNVCSGERRQVRKEGRPRGGMRPSQHRRWRGGEKL